MSGVRLSAGDDVQVHEVPREAGPLQLGSVRLGEDREIESSAPNRASLRCPPPCWVCSATRDVPSGDHLTAVVTPWPTDSHSTTVRPVSTSTRVTASSPCPTATRSPATETSRAGPLMSGTANLATSEKSCQRRTTTPGSPPAAVPGPSTTRPFALIHSDSSGTRAVSTGSSTSVRSQRASHSPSTTRASRPDGAMKIGTVWGGGSRRAVPSGGGGPAAAGRLRCSCRRRRSVTTQRSHAVEPSAVRPPRCGGITGPARTPGNCSTVTATDRCYVPDAQLSGTSGRRPQRLRGCPRGSGSGSGRGCREPGTGSVPGVRATGRVAPARGDR